MTLALLTSSLVYFKGEAARGDLLRKVEPEDALQYYEKCATVIRFVRGIRVGGVSGAKLRMEWT